MDVPFAQAVADTMHALSTPSRVRILGQLQNGAISVNELAEAVHMTPSAVSQQLRILRHLGFVTGARDGRRILYDLHNDHIADLLEAAIGHIEHQQLGITGRRSRASTTDHAQTHVRA
jgi:DNA-binding transcriptional ArsR family regulator